jgi:hypothetical protein
MKLLLAIPVCWLLAGSAVAQRGDMGGGFRGGSRPGRDMIGSGCDGFRFGSRFFFGHHFFNRAFDSFGSSTAGSPSMVPARLLMNLIMSLAN